MPKVGLKYLMWAPHQTESASAVPTYSAGKVLGKICSLEEALNNAEGELYADDALAEYASDFSSCDITAEINDMPLTNMADLYGSTLNGESATTDPSVLDDGVQDAAPYGGLGGVQILLTGSTRTYRAWHYLKVKAIKPDESATTRKNSIDFGTYSVKFKAVAPNYGPWRQRKDFDSEAEAVAWVKGKLSIT